MHAARKCIERRKNPRTKTQVQSRSATRTLLRKKNALDNEKLAARDSAYCLHFSALAFYIFQHRLGFTSASRLSLFLGRMTMRSTRCDSRRDTSASHERAFSFLRCFTLRPRPKSHVTILRSRVECVNTN